ncbi:MAG TPA: phosphopantetheine-binding protein [Lentisphaeria bacterium]|nr:phosphopantetheine-binding protein [Lentisphaeria bacterium]
MDEQTANFRRDFKANLIDWLQIEDKTPNDIVDDQPLFGEGLGLDSLDAVEIVIMLQRKYNINQREVDEKREVFATFATLSDFVQERSARQ